MLSLGDYAMRFLLWCAVALSLATSALAADVTAEQVTAFRPGVSTYKDVVASFGSPSSENVLSDGSRTITYVSVRSHVRAVTLVPIIGLLIGGAKSTISTASFAFGSDGRLMQSSSSSKTADCSANVVLSVGGGCVKGGPAPAP
jgi:hypothetical protein